MFFLVIGGEIENTIIFQDYYCEFQIYLLFVEEIKNKLVESMCGKIVLYAIERKISW